MAAAVTPSAVAKLWRKDVPREARYAGLRDLLEEDASEQRDSLTVKTTPATARRRSSTNICRTTPLRLWVLCYKTSALPMIEPPRSAWHCSCGSPVGAHRSSRRHWWRRDSRGKLCQGQRWMQLASLQNNELAAASAALEAYACGPSKGPEPAEYASRWCVVACAALKKDNSRLETAALSVLDAVVRRSTIDPAYALCVQILESRGTQFSQPDASRRRGVLGLRPGVEVRRPPTFCCEGRRRFTAAGRFHTEKGVDLYQIGSHNERSRKC